jgi:hypothetical protein
MPSSPEEPTYQADHEADSCPFMHIDGMCAGEAFYEIKNIDALAGPPQYPPPGIYDKMVSRETGGSDPLVQEPGP